jgi:hypothetical protein
MRRAVMLMLVAGSMSVAAQSQAPFVSPWRPDEIRDLQAVLDTSMGPIVIDLLADQAPNHVALFVQTARELSLIHI